MKHSRNSSSGTTSTSPSRKRIGRKTIGSGQDKPSTPLLALKLEPKSQAEARKSPQAAKWKQAEHVELKTIWDMGTFQVVDRPSHHLKTRRSVTGYLNVMNGAAVSWQSVRQQVVALSSAEAEYYAASVAGTDVQYIRRLTEELGYPQPGATQLFEDNMACIFMSESAAMYHKARHIDTRVYHLRELCKEGSLKLIKVESARQAADSLTKGTPRPLFEAHRRVMLGG
mmetsp:Transcript_61192/g.126355  ORF Transcript_61192/g.126355 Transcript_61192/m.126355 type:complete len:227 (+) Transcript_61192:2192-2872(+)